MKLIDLLVKIVNNQELPKKVLIFDKVYYLLKKDNKYFYSRNNHNFRDWEQDLDHSINICCCLNDEVTILDKNSNEIEIIEKKPKKIEKFIKTDVIYEDPSTMPNYICKQKYDYTSEETFEKLNEIIDGFNYLLEKSDSE